MSDFPPFVRGSDTSAAAAESVEKITSRLRKRIYETIAIYCHGDPPTGRTCDEIEVLLAMRHQTASARINELHRKKYINDSGRTRKTRSGRNAVVWIIERSK